MDLLPEGYNLDTPTWFYLSMLLIIAVFFRFHRLWSLRNVDLCLLLCASPGLILIQQPESYRWGSMLLGGVTFLFLLRTLMDGLLQRRPHTTQNLNPAGLAFLCASAFVLLSMHSFSRAPSEAANATMEAGERLLDRTAQAEVAASVNTPEARVESGPVFGVFAAWLQMMFHQFAPRVMAMLAHLAVIVGLLMVGRNLFGDLQLGTAMSTLYMLVPCTAYSADAFHHVLPAALIIWAVVAYQRPVVSGILLGLACGTLVFPVFLVPLWAAFYGRHHAGRFLASLAIVTVALLGTYALTSPDPLVFWQQAITTIKLPLHALLGEDIAVSSWTEISAPHRIPIVVGYLILLIGLTVWPRKKNIEHLIAHSATLIVGTQFWYSQQAGAYLLWYLPLLLIVIFRPRIAQLDQNRRTSTIAEIKTTAAAPEVRPSSRLASGQSLRRATLFR